MVVMIEQQEEERKETVTNPPKSSADSKATESGDASDGFETASDRDVSDSDDNNEHGEKEQHVPTTEEEDNGKEDGLKQVDFPSLLLMLCEILKFDVL